MKKISRSKILFGSLFFAFSSMTFATPATDKSVQQFFAVIKYQEQMQTLMQKMTPLFDQQANQFLSVTLKRTVTENTEDQLAIIKISQLFQEIVNKAYQDPAIHSKFEKIYLNNFTEEEIQAFIKFFSSPEGQSYLQKTPSVFSESFQVGKDTILDYIKNPKVIKEYAPQLHKIVDELKKSQP
ncbi:DUF2059 domain-containing protein [Acinetobacter gerneri]|uniref:DUF2059 domain-containing protein n=1 Tax=Acinetobacter gerneri TaxID=202952 RepID=UPI0029364482|nr:DUF2059 domain-containing protein [Acinetobacter gerneri]MDV2438342.1 DUF2059 domain-containing protein [Acinetobacter gerneri]